MMRTLYIHILPFLFIIFLFPKCSPEKDKEESPKSLQERAEAFDFEGKDTVLRREFYENGALWREAYVLKEDTGFYHGPFKQFYENGELQIEGIYYNDKKEGIFYAYDSLGNLGLKLFFDNGMQDSGVRYNIYGNIYREASFDNDTLNGVLKEYDKKGETVVSKYYFDNGNLIKKEYEKLGQEIDPYALRRDIEIRDTFLVVDRFKENFTLYESKTQQGIKKAMVERKSYYIEGNETIIRDSSGLDEHNWRHGLYKRFSKDGYLEQKGWFNHGKEDSVWTYYDKDGEIWKKEKWDDGEKQ